MTTLTPLNRQTTGKPVTYPERIVQFGAGNFLRGFADWIIEQLNQQANFQSSVVVVKVTPQGKYNDLDTQDGLFHVHVEGIQNGAPVNQTHLITCVNRCVYPHDDYAAYQALARQPDIRFLISNTTESGIQYNEGDKATDQPPASFPAKIALFLYERYQHFAGAADKGCIIIPTELIEDNATQLRGMILRFAEQWGLDAGFSQWVSEHNLFCNTLVDRIVPGFPAARKAAFLEELGYDDRMLVMCEPYHLWVIEAPQRLNAALPVDKTNLNIKIVESATPYRLTKVRILNGLHTSMLLIGSLLGLETVRDCIEHPQLGAFLQAEAYQEIIPATDVPQAGLEQFTADVFDRFRNPAIEHRLSSIALNCTAKIKVRLIPTILDYVRKRQALPPRVVLALAAYIQFYKGEWQGRSLPVSDDPQIIAWFHDQWQTAPSTGSLVAATLANANLWSADLTTIPQLQTQLTQYLTQIADGELPQLLASLG
ncbi:MAG: tagaturonate reductase [Chloroflexi bacterium]|nr:tagaturonate reductase [Chloroflexota bacterium]MCC6897304.1 tagaturonate reductase [Anaerolineae bacterium]